MDALARDPRLRAFRATDAYALEVYRVARTLRVSDHADLVDEMRSEHDLHNDDTTLLRVEVS